jgi:ABC-type phosphate transport system substrate-binding protein
LNDAASDTSQAGIGGQAPQPEHPQVRTGRSRVDSARRYSGMAFAVDGVKMLSISRHRGGPGVAPTIATALDGSYPLARPLYLYSSAVPTGAVEAFLGWVVSAEGQAIVRELRFVPARTARGST